MRNAYLCGFSGKLKNVLDCGKHLLDLSADPELRDASGDTPLLAIRHLLDQSRYSEAYEAVCLLTTHQVDVNVRDLKTDQTLLSFAVQHGDRAEKITRHLLNSGARVWNEPTYKVLLDNSAFKSFLKALMTKRTTIEASTNTINMLCMVMAADVNRMILHVNRCMIELGVAPKVNGPLFLRLRAKMAPFMAKPQSLRSISLAQIRHSILRKNPKRLQRNQLSQLKLSSVTASRVCQLQLPQKLQNYICLGEEPSSP